ncbi:MAG TPA: chemotaxis protein CheB [Terriglobales bacterium]|nr:chemotaxis protein CheB [Terriglobales bacterium]
MVRSRKKKPIARGISNASPRFHVVAVGASAGGFHALAELLRPLPAGFPGSIVVVQHLYPTRESLLANLLQNHTALRVKQAVHDEIMLPGHVYIAPPDQHLLVGPGKIQLAHTRLVHFSRPSIDLLFESVAGVYGSRSIGIILTGTLKDGSAGIRAIKEAGGVTMAQDPADAEFDSMPAAAVATGCVDYSLPIAELGITLKGLYAARSPKPYG